MDVTWFIQVRLAERGRSGYIGDDQDAIKIWLIWPDEVELLDFGRPRSIEVYGRTRGQMSSMSYIYLYLPVPNPARFADVDLPPTGHMQYNQKYEQIFQKRTWCNHLGIR